jgi:hypothetical protein
LFILVSTRLQLRFYLLFLNVKALTTTPTRVLLARFRGSHYYTTTLTRSSSLRDFVSYSYSTRLNLFRILTLPPHRRKFSCVVFYVFSCLLVYRNIDTSNFLRSLGFPSPTSTCGFVSRSYTTIHRHKSLL